MDNLDNSNLKGTIGYGLFPAFWLVFVCSYAKVKLIIIIILIHAFNTGIIFYILK